SAEFSGGGGTSVGIEEEVTSSRGAGSKRAAKRIQSRKRTPAGEALPPSKALTGHGQARALGLRAPGCRVHCTADHFKNGGFHGTAQRRAEKGRATPQGGEASAAIPACPRATGGAHLAQWLLPL